MFEKIKLFFQLFQKGRELSKKEFWKQQQSTVLPLVMGFIVVAINLAKSFGVQIDVDQDVIYWLAGSCYMVINSILTIITSKHAGIGSVPATDSGEAQSSMPSLPSSPEGAGNPTMPSETEAKSPDFSRFDDDTVRRAREWLERQGVDGKPIPEGQTNVFNTMG